MKKYTIVIDESQRMLLMAALLLLEERMRQEEDLLGMLKSLPTDQRVNGEGCISDLTA